MAVYCRFQIGARALLDRRRDLLHPLVARRLGEHLSAGDDAVDDGDQAAGHGEQDERHVVPLVSRPGSVVVRWSRVAGNLTGRAGKVKRGDGPAALSAPNRGGRAGRPLVRRARASAPAPSPADRRRSRAGRRRGGRGGEQQDMVVARRSGAQERVGERPWAAAQAGDTGTSVSVAPRPLAAASRAASISRPSTRPSSRGPHPRRRGRARGGGAGSGRRRWWGRGRQPPRCHATRLLLPTSVLLRKQEPFPLSPL